MNRKTITLMGSGLLLLIAAGAAAWTILGGRDKALPVRTEPVERVEHLDSHLSASGSIHLVTATKDTGTSASQGIVALKIGQADITKLKLGQDARVSFSPFPWKLAGHVSKIGQMALPENLSDARDFKVEVTVDRVQPDVREGMSCTAEIVITKKENVLAIPQSAITWRQGAGSPQADAKRRSKAGEKGVQGVFIMGDDGLAHFRAVKIDFMSDMKFGVKSGLNEDDEVITGPLDTLRKLEERTPVRPETEEDRAKAERAAAEAAAKAEAEAKAKAEEKK